MVQWPESLADDYLHRPEQLKDVCSYEFTELYKKKFYSLKDVDDEKQNGIITNTKSERCRFTTTHPGHEFAYLEKLRLPAVVVVSLPEGKLCLVRNLQLDNDTPSDVAKDEREGYAKMALMMFYPFRELKDLKKDNSYWNRFKEERARHFEGKETTFWKIGFEILQNIEDNEMMTQSEYRMRARDPIQKATIINADEAKKQQSKDDKKAIPDISHLCDDESSYAESDIDDAESENGKRWSHNTLIAKAGNITKERLISARLASEQPILKSSDSDQLQGSEATNEDDNTGKEFSDWFRDKSYPSLLKLISGTLVGVTGYNDIYDSVVVIHLMTKMKS